MVEVFYCPRPESIAENSTMSTILFTLCTSVTSVAWLVGIPNFPCPSVRKTNHTVGGHHFFFKASPPQRSTAQFSRATGRSTPADSGCPPPSACQIPPATAPAPPSSIASPAPGILRSPRHSARPFSRHNQCLQSHLRFEGTCVSFTLSFAHSSAVF